VVLRFALLLCVASCGSDVVPNDGGDDAPNDSTLDSALWPDANVVDAEPVPPDVGAPPTAECIDGGTVCPPRDPMCDGDDWEVDYKAGPCIGGSCTYAISFRNCQPPESVCMSTGVPPRPDGGFCYFTGN
jgi:hypothetical protein